ncbi:hypothetical protein FI667_g4091, partial [Globisporangium splendens]
MVQPEDQQPAASDGDAWRRFQAEIAQCWIAEAIAHVCARAAAVHLTQSYALVALRASPPSAAATHDANAVDTFVNICALTARFQQLLGVNGADHGSTESASDVDAFAQWLRMYHERLEQQHCWERTCLVVLFAPSIAVETMQALEDVIRAADHARGMHTILLVLSNPIGLLDVRGPSESFSHCVRLSDSKANTHEQQQSTASYRDVLLRPLKQLSVQCGWRFVLEIARSAVFCPPDASAVTSSSSSSSLFTSLSQLPFQLMLLVLRWSHFHPRLVDALAKLFARKLRLIPQVRIRDAIARLQQQQLALWNDLYPSTTKIDEELLSLSLQDATSSRLKIPTRGDASFQKLGRVAQCHLWQVQKQFYLHQGINAWSDGIIPFGVSCSSFLAATYARIAADFFLEASASWSASDGYDATNSTSMPLLPNCFVWEAASGSCKLLHAFLVHFFAIVDSEAAFAERQLVPCVIASDLSDDVLDSRMEMTCFASFLQTGRLDFAKFDTETFVHGDTRRTLFLKHTQRTWHVGSQGESVLLMGNYFFDSLRTDVFAVTQVPPSPPSKGEENGANPLHQHRSERMNVYEGRVDQTITSIVDMELTFQQIDPFASAVYGDDQMLNNVLMDVLDAINAAPHTSSSLILFPVEAITFLRTLIEVEVTGDQDYKTPMMYSGFPLGMLIGDAAFSFRDPISSAFFSSADDENGANELELPQLSPHPDCFCLPVDFEILRMVFKRLTSSSRSSTSSSSVLVASAVATDTFDVLYGRVIPLQRHTDTPSSASPVLALKEVTPACSSIAFLQEFASFTPSDCDLLWGMMGVDDGAHHFSMKTQLALLAQSAWDFDLFVILQWTLMQHWRTSKTRQQAQRPGGLRVLRLRLVSMGITSWNTYYVLDGEKEDDAKALNLLQFSRWLYGKVHTVLLRSSS